MELTDRFDSAFLWASALHRNQRRKGQDIPYLSHLIAVAGLVIEHGGDEDQAIAALLHDSIEDTDVTEDDIRERFGDRVAEIVRACTDADVVPKPPWLTRKRSYIEHLASAPSDALLVSLADKAHNARTIATDYARVGDAYFSVFKGGADGSRWYYRRLADVFVQRVAALPAEMIDGRSRPGGPGLLAAYLAAIEALGATPAVADAFEVNMETWVEHAGA